MLTAAIGGGRAVSTAGTTTCQDCGNQAKKDCPHRRCRTCCKTKGYECPTHMKSTWYPASRRRERQPFPAEPGSSMTKKPHLSRVSPPESFDASRSHQGRVCAPAVFKCVRVSALDAGEDEYAYQAVVRIGGHVFKGFLYDQGVAERDTFSNTSAGAGGGRSGCSSSPPAPADIFAASGGGTFVGGSTYGNTLN